MPGAAAVSLRGRRDGGAPEFLRPVNFRTTDELHRYIKEEAVQTHRKEQAVINDALRMDRDLGKLLEPEVERLEAFAASQRLTLERDLAEVFSRLILLGLDAAEPKRPKK